MITRPMITDPGPFVSVLVTTYNHAAFIDAAVQSVVDQSYQHFELVVADDGSADSTPASVRRWAERDHRVVPLLAPSNQGLSTNWNRGLDRCRGEYIAALSGDDLMLPGRLAAQVAFLREHPECGVCTHDMEVFDSDTGRTLYRLSDRFARKDGGAEVMFTTNWLFGREIKSIPSSHMFRATAIGSHRYDARLRIMNEWLFEIDCLVTSGLRWASLPEVLGRYRMHEGQSSTSEEARRLGFEETLLVLTIASVRYPALARLIKNKRDYLLFRHLLFDWFAEGERGAYDREFRIEAGVLKWLYMRGARLVRRHHWLLDATRPARQFARWVLHRT